MKVGLDEGTGSKNLLPACLITGDSRTSTMDMVVAVNESVVTLGDDEAECSELDTNPDDAGPEDSPTSAMRTASILVQSTHILFKPHHRCPTS